MKWPNRGNKYKTAVRAAGINSKGWSLFRVYLLEASGKGGFGSLNVKHSQFSIFSSLTAREEQEEASCRLN